MIYFPKPLTIVTGQIGEGKTTATLILASEQDSKFEYGFTTWELGFTRLNITRNQLFILDDTHITYLSPQKSPYLHEILEVVKKRNHRLVLVLQPNSKIKYYCKPQWCKL